MLADGRAPTLAYFAAGIVAGARAVAAFSAKPAMSEAGIAM
jgi:hypothetical protein